MEDKNYSSGVGFLGLLALIFITLKITGFINWSWLWVLAPIWGGSSTSSSINISDIYKRINKDKERR